MERPAVLKPKPLLPGARIAIVSPASAVNRLRAERGLEALRRLGYEPVIFPHTFASGPLTFAGTLDERLSDLHAAFADPAIDAICCTRGGWGTAELLPGLDLALIRANPKPFLGYSDHTSLQTWVSQETGLVTFHAPMIGPDFARGDSTDELAGVHLPSWHAALSSMAPWSLGASAGLRVLRPAQDAAAPAQVTGPLRGGCLSLLAEALGTAFAPRSWSESIVFLEDVNTRPYQWDRMLLHLGYAGLFDGVRAIIFGDMKQCVPDAEAAALEDWLRHSLRGFPGPICIGLQSGHVNEANVTLPLGVEVMLDLSGSPLLHVVESAVETTGKE